MSTDDASGGGPAAGDGPLTPAGPGAARSATAAAGDDGELALPVPPERALAVLATVVERWGADWDPKLATLCLPVQAGLRHGLLTTRVEATPAPGGSRLRLAVERVDWQLHRQAVALLVVAGIAALAGTLWPFFPLLARLTPLALVLGVGSWLVILSRLKNRGLRELLAEVAAESRAPAGD